MCSTEVPSMCRNYIPYVSYPNERFGLYNESDYYNVTADLIETIEQSCNSSDQQSIQWGVCNMIFPRCLMGFPLYLCRESCLGECANDRRLTARRDHCASAPWSIHVGLVAWP